MTTGFQNLNMPQYNQYGQIRQNSQNTVPKQNEQTQNTGYNCACQAYSNNPYLCAYTPVSYMVLPQGQVPMPQTIPQQMTVNATQLPPPAPNVNYNQITPYLNSNSKIFHPSIQTKSGQAIATASAVSQPLTQQEAQIVYQGPVRTVNPQITPIEQSDNEIEKQYRDYYTQKAGVNSEMRKALHNTIGYDEGKSSFFSKAVKILVIALAIAGIYKYRTKIPFLKRFFK